MTGHLVKISALDNRTGERRSIASGMEVVRKRYPGRWIEYDGMEGGSGDRVLYRFRVSHDTQPPHTRGTPSRFK